MWVQDGNPCDSRSSLHTDMLLLHSLGKSMEDDHHLTRHGYSVQAWLIKEWAAAARQCSVTKAALSTMSQGATGLAKQCTREVVQWMLHLQLGRRQEPGQQAGQALRQKQQHTRWQQPQQNQAILESIDSTLSLLDAAGMCSLRELFYMSTQPRCNFMAPSMPQAFAGVQQSTGQGVHTCVCSIHQPLMYFHGLSFVSCV